MWWNFCSIDVLIEFLYTHLPLALIAWTLDEPELAVPLVQLYLTNLPLIQTSIVSVGAGMRDQIYQLVGYVGQAML